MKTKLATFFLALSTLTSMATYANSIPEGTFKGQGLWKSETKTGKYEVSTTIVGDTIKTSYTWENHDQFEFEFQTHDLANGFFEIQIDGHKFGKGYCLEGAIVCHYEIDFSSENNPEKVRLEETLTIQDGKLYRFGHKNWIAGQYHTDVFWQEALESEKKN